MNPVVETQYGKVRGLDLGTHYEFRGVPFAQPPAGELRWRAPQPCRPWGGTGVSGTEENEEIYDATVFPARAPQYDCSDMPLYGKEFYSLAEYRRPSDEDCLYLNIWCPKKHPQKGGTGEGRGYPVAVWIHGGGFDHGYSTEMEFDGEAYCERGVLLVTIPYRLGVFGFLSIPERRREDGFSGSYGLMDQLFALQWVQDNIAAFGGDPGNITLFGQSAGCASALDLWCSPRSAGLFHRVILQSGAGYRPALRLFMERGESEAVYRDLTQELGVSGYEELIRLPADTLVDAFFRLPLLRGGGLLCPAADGYVLQQSPDEVIGSGAIRPLPCMIGSTKDDIATEGATRQRPAGRLWEAQLRFIDQMKRHGKPVPYLYYFAHDLPGSQDGAFHSSELWYTFGTWKRCWRPMREEDAALSEEMLDAWCSFMRDGQPVMPRSGQRWEPCTNGQYHTFA